MRRSVYITGGHGFLGREVCRLFQHVGWTVKAPLSAEVDFRKPFHVDTGHSLIVHCAGRVGGIGANRVKPATFFADNMRMGLNVLDAAAAARTPLIMVGTTCSYPADLEPPFREEQLWNGYPEATNAAYGIAKRALIEATRAYVQEFGLRAAVLVLANLYGPGDNDDLVTSHVVPAVIRKVRHAVLRGDKTVEMWGDGTPTRDLLYVRDAARAIYAAIDLVQEGSMSICNVGTGIEVSIAELVLVVQALCGSSCDVVWDCSQPNGQQRRALDASRFRTATGWQPQVSLREGLRRTIDVTPEDVA